MAQSVMLKKGEFSKEGYVEFSWTIFCFGFIAPMCRGDWEWALMMFLPALCIY